MSIENHALEIFIGDRRLVIAQLLSAGSSVLIQRQAQRGAIVFEEPEIAV